jgi:hypothetical protein
MLTDLAAQVVRVLEELAAPPRPERYRLTISAVAVTRLHRTTAYAAATARATVPAEIHWPLPVLMTARSIP